MFDVLIKKADVEELEQESSNKVKDDNSGTSTKNVSYNI